MTDSTWQGNNHDPITLHKYAYGNADPVTYTDPSGHFGLASFGVANNIRMSLANMQTEFGFSILDSAISGDVGEPSPMAMGLAAIGGAGAFKMLSLLSGKFRQACSIANSFDGETLVATEQGLVAIQNIRIGDKVWACNEETGERSLQPVVHLIERKGSKEIVEISLASGEVIKATSGHPFYVDGEWKDAGALAINDLLQRLNGEPLAVVGLLAQSEQTKVYNLTVANDHTYYVGESEVLAHNAGCKAPTKYNWDHIFEGDFKGEKFHRFHHREGGITPANRIVTPNGVKSGDFYEATVKGNGKPKAGISTFFPDNWSREQVKNVVNQGIILKQGKGGEVPMANLWPGAPRNVVLKIVIHGDTLTSAYPVIKKM